MPGSTVSFQPISAQKLSSKTKDPAPQKCNAIHVYWFFFFANDTGLTWFMFLLI